MSAIDQNIELVRKRIDAAASRANRSATDITLIAVTKTHSPGVISQAIAAGLYHLGENRLQEASAKIPALAAEHPDLTWHLIGHLQRNKAKLAVQLFDMIHSLDSLRLAETLDRYVGALAERRRLPVLLQVNISGEASKEGMPAPGGRLDHPDSAPFQADLEAILTLQHLDVQGLMTIAPWSDNPETTRPIFRRLHQLRDALARRYPTLPWQHLSMGMTDDFEVAIEEGATLVRVGRAIFGERERR